MEGKIGKMTRKAEVLFSDGSRLSGNFFVSSTSPTHSGSESIWDMLTSERLYLPFQSDQGDILLIQIECIVMVLLVGNDEMNKDLPYTKTISDQVCFLTGETLEGKFYLDLPESRSRLSDFLNENIKFFYLEAQEKDYLVNSRFVKWVLPVSTE